MSSVEQGPKGVGGIVTSSDKASTYVETVKSTTDTEIGSSSGECRKPQYKVSGTVKASQKGVANVTITGGGKETTSGSKGEYSLTFDEGTDVTLTFALRFHTTVTRVIGPLTKNVTENVTLTRRKWKVSGKLDFGTDTPKELRIELTGLDKEKGVVTSDTFRFSDIPEGVPVTISVYSDTGALQRPDDIVIESVTADLENQNFKFKRKSLKITGTVKDGSAALSGVTVTLEGRTPVVTLEPGTFELDDIVAGEAYKVTAEHKHFTFEPYRNPSLTSDPEIEFVATRKKWSVQGTVNFADDALKQVTVKIAGPMLSAAKTVKTGKGGTYAFTDLPSGGKYTLSIDPGTHYNVTASPAAIDELSQNETGRDFTGAWRTWTFSGNVKEQLRYSQADLAKVPLTLSGHAKGTADTDVSGNYSFTVTAGGTYVVAHDPLPPFQFNHARFRGANVSANVVGNFIATWASPKGGITRDPEETTYGLDVVTCATCNGRPMTHAASPLRETATSIAKCRELYRIIRGIHPKFGTMVGVLVCDDGGTEKYIGAHSGEDDYPDEWQSKATTGGFVVGTYVAPSALRTRGQNALGSTGKAGPNEVGRCAAPKLLHAANVNGWTPLGMTEMSLNLKGYTEGKTISSCLTCQSIVAQLLCDA